MRVPFLKEGIKLGMKLRKKKKNEKINLYRCFIYIY